MTWACFDASGPWRVATVIVQVDSSLRCQGNHPWTKATESESRDVLLSKRRYSFFKMLINRNPSFFSLYYNTILSQSFVSEKWMNRKLLCHQKPIMQVKNWEQDRITSELNRNSEEKCQELQYHNSVSVFLSDTVQGFNAKPKKDIFCMSSCISLWCITSWNSSMYCLFLFILPSILCAVMGSYAWEQWTVKVTGARNHLPEDITLNLFWDWELKAQSELLAQVV